jgi:hypothetical protein
VSCMSCMQAIIETGEADFNPAQWLRSASFAEASTLYKGSASEDDMQCPDSASRSNGSSTIEAPSSILEGSILQGAFERASELAAFPGKSPEADASSTSHGAVGCPFIAQSFKQKEAQATKKLVFGVGPRSCVGQNLAVSELVAFLIVLAREVREVKISVEEQERQMAPVFPHPTGIPARFIPRKF